MKQFLQTTVLSTVAAGFALVPADSHAYFCCLIQKVFYIVSLILCCGSSSPE